MRDRVPVFRQTTDFTCGACATLMVWRHLDSNVQLSKQNEFLIWTEIVGLPFKFSSPYRIAEFFIKKGFETKLIMKQESVSEDIMALECCQVEPAERKLFLDFFQAYDRTLRNRVAPAILDKKPTIYDIRKALSNHDPIIALVDSYYTAAAKKPPAQPHLPHWIVVTGCDNKRFHANDPAQGKITIEKRVLEEALDTRSSFGWPSTLIIVKSKANARRTRKASV
ncbi:MAG: peptidase C39 family protein [Candidatus Bathyarchaeota archaeon]|nr:peptidase C39 family protein [Candidatus Bathyarchaeota archaeon]